MPYYFRFSNRLSGLSSSWGNKLDVHGSGDVQIWGKSCTSFGLPVAAFIEIRSRLVFVLRMKRNIPLPWR